MKAAPLRLGMHDLYLRFSCWYPGCCWYQQALRTRFVKRGYFFYYYYHLSIGTHAHLTTATVNACVCFLFNCCFSFVSRLCCCTICMFFFWWAALSSNLLGLGCLGACRMWLFFSPLLLTCAILLNNPGFSFDTENVQRERGLLRSAGLRQIGADFVFDRDYRRLRVVHNGAATIKNTETPRNSRKFLSQVHSDWLISDHTSNSCWREVIRSHWVSTKRTKLNGWMNGRMWNH